MRQSQSGGLAGELKLALRTLARSVVIATTWWKGRAYAMATTALCEVCLDPPSMLVCINRRASMYPAIEARALIALNILTSAQEEVARACGGALQGEDRFKVGSWMKEEGIDAPVLQDAAAVVALRHAWSIDHGTHRIVVGEVERVVLRAPADPLVYCRGAYVALNSADR